MVAKVVRGGIPVWFCRFALIVKPTTTIAAAGSAGLASVLLFIVATFIVVADMIVGTLSDANRINCIGAWGGIVLASSYGLIRIRANTTTTPTTPTLRLPRRWTSGDVPDTRAVVSISAFVFVFVFIFIFGLRLIASNGNLGLSRRGSGTGDPSPGRLLLRRLRTRGDGLGAGFVAL
ncbi:hypothetical protein FPOAC2_13477 [Fusarium poae]